MQTVGKIQLIKEVRTDLDCGLYEAKQLVDECCLNLFGTISIPDDISMQTYNQLALMCNHRIQAIRDNTARVIVSRDGTIIEERDCIVVELTPKQLFNIQECMTDSERYHYARTCGGRYVR